MKYQLGEFVRFVDEKREGYITKIINDEMVGVTGDDDFEIPVMVNNLTRVHGHETNIVEKQEIVAQQTSMEQFVEKGIFLGVLSDKNKGSVVHFHFINQSSYQVLMTLKTNLKEVWKGEFASIINQQSETKIYSASLSEMDLWADFSFQALFYTHLNKPLKKPLEFNIKFRAKDLSGSKTMIPILKDNGWLIRMDKPELILDAQKIKESFFKPAEEKKELERPAKEVDLHIEKLRDDHDFLNKHEILQMQLAQFEKSLESAIVHKFEEIIFIHGAGNGTLQHEIHKVISKHPQVKTFMDAQKEKFGYGATKVVLK